jgi:hypothetical protein
MSTFLLPAELGNDGSKMRGLFFTVDGFATAGTGVALKDAGLAEVRAMRFAVKVSAIEKRPGGARGARRNKT